MRIIFKYMGMNMKTKWKAVICLFFLFLINTNADELINCNTATYLEGEKKNLSLALTGVDGEDIIIALAAYFNPTDDVSGPYYMTGTCTDPNSGDIKWTENSISLIDPDGKNIQDPKISVNSLGYFVIVYHKVNSGQNTIFYTSGRVTLEGETLEVQTFMSGESIVDVGGNPLKGTMPDVTVTGGGTVIIAYIDIDEQLSYRSGYIQGHKGVEKYNQNLENNENLSDGELGWAMQYGNIDHKLVPKKINSVSITSSYNSSEIYGGHDRKIAILGYTVNDASLQDALLCQIIVLSGTRIESPLPDPQLEITYFGYRITPFITGGFSLSMSENDNVIATYRFNEEDETGEYPIDYRNGLFHFDRINPEKSFILFGGSRNIAHGKHPTVACSPVTNHVFTGGGKGTNVWVLPSFWLDYPKNPNDKN